MPSTPASLHSSDCSGGAANMENRRTVSAPNLSTIVCGSTPLFLDLDIFSVPPICTGLPSDLSTAPMTRAFSSRWMSTSAGLIQSFEPSAFSRIERLGDHHALAQQIGRRLVRLHHARVAHQLVVEAEIQQMQDRVFDTADVLINRQPVVGALVDLAVGTRAGVTRVVPARLHEGVEGVGLALGRTAALWAGGLAPFGIGLDRRLHAGERDVFRQHHRQLVFRHRHRIALGAIDHRDRTAPVTLAADAPVAQAPVDATHAFIAGFQFLGEESKASR